MKYRICEYCGDHLDFGEQCDCRKGVKPIQFEKMLEEKPVLIRSGVKSRNKPSHGINISQTLIGCGTPDRSRKGEKWG